MQRPRTDAAITRDGNRSKATEGSATQDTHLAVALHRFISLFLFDVSSVCLSPDFYGCDHAFLFVREGSLKKRAFL